MAGHGSDRPDRYGILAEINMVPLIDVALVLLIIFMIMTPFLVRAQLKMDVPDAETGNIIKDEARMLTIQVALDGQALLEGVSVPPGSLKEEILKRTPNPASWTVIVEADRNCALDHVVNVMDTARKAGISKLGVAVRREKEKRARR